MENYTNPETSSAPQSNKKKLIVLSSVIAAVAVLVIAVVLIISSLSSKIDVCEYVKVKEVTGFNDTGSVNIEFDYVKLAKDLEFEEIKDIKELADVQETNNFSLEYTIGNLDYLEDAYDLDLDELEDLFEAVSIKIDNNGSFSNGDTAIIEIKVDEDEEYGSLLTGGEIEHKIKDLKSLVALTVDFDCTFSGLNGDGVANAFVVTDDPENWHEYVYFNIPSNGSLSNGDQISVEAYIENYEEIYSRLQAEGYELPRSFTKDFTVSGLGEKLTPDTCTDAIIDQAEAIVKENVKLADPTLSPIVSMVYFVEDDDQSYIVVALEFPDSAANRTWNHIRALSGVYITADGELSYNSIEHVLGGNGFKAQQQESYILNFDDFYGCEFTKLR